jgi:hypothetical protein
LLDGELCGVSGDAEKEIGGKVEYRAAYLMICDLKKPESVALPSAFLYRQEEVCLTNKLFPELLEEPLVNVKRRLRDQAQLKPLKHVNQIVRVHEFNGGDAVTASFLLCVHGERTGGNDYAFVRASHHRTAKIPNLGRKGHQNLTFGASFASAAASK